MSYQEKKTIVSMLTGVLLLAAYCVFAYLNYRTGGPEIGQDLSFWAASMLVFIGIGIGAAIITQIIFHIVIAAGSEIKRHIAAEITKEMTQADRKPINSAADDEMDWSEFDTEDEMDKLIGLKAMRISYAIVGVGFILALVTLVVKLPPAVMLNTIFVAACLASLTEGAASLYYYRKGI